MKNVLVCLTAVSLMSCQSPGTTTEAGSRFGVACASNAASAEISATIRAFFEALASDDDAAIARLTSPGFRAFDVGRRFTGPELSQLIADAHRSGRILQWTIGPVDVRVDCTTAFAVWENTGATGTTSRMEPRAWLETAWLVRQDEKWVIDFLHSTPKDPRY